MIKVKNLHMATSTWFSLFLDRASGQLTPNKTEAFLIVNNDKGHDNAIHSDSWASLSSDSQGQLNLNAIDQLDSSFIGLSQSIKTGITVEDVYAERVEFVSKYGSADAANFVYTGVNAAPNSWWALFTGKDPLTGTRVTALSKVGIIVAANSVYSDKTPCEHAELLTYSFTRLGLLRTIPDQRFPGFHACYRTHDAALAAQKALM